MVKGKTVDLADWLRSIIQDFVNNSKENTIHDPSHEKAWDHPLVGFSRGDDPLYDAYREHVGPFHWTPWEIFTMTFPDITVKPGDLTIVSWILPQTEPTKADNRKETTYASERWAKTRLYGEQINDRLRKHVVTVLQENGYRAIAPVLSPQWSQKTSDRYGFSSTWSERHAAYASGLGTFGLSDGLITERGKAVRIGSVVALINIPPSPRPYDNHQSYCLFFSQEICGKCIPRCPVGAITEAGHDKIKCFNHCYKTSKDYTKFHYGLDVGACGLCQTKVPCESKIPVKTDI
jgi:epoxyqueuosine reductase